MAETTTPNLSLKLAVPGTNEPFSTAEVNENFTAIDTEVGARRSADTSLDARLDAIEPYTLPNFAAAQARYGLVPAGTTAQRDAYWGTAGGTLPTAAERIALAQRIARWHNTEKGYVQQYYAQFDDALITPMTPAKTVHGWGPEQSVGRVPIKADGAITAESGTIVAHGGKYVFTGVGGGMRVNNLFTSDFEAYEFVFDFTTGGIDGNVGLNLVAAGVVLPATAWGRNNTEVTNGGTTNATASSGQPTVTIGRIAAAGGGAVVATVFNPANAKQKFVLSRSVDRSNYQNFGSGNSAQTTVCDGVEIRFSGGMTATGSFRVFGINDY